MKATSGSYLACCLPPKPPPGSGAKTRTLASGRPSTPGDDPLQPVRVLDRAPDRDAVAVRGGHEGVRLDGELGDHREGVGALDDDVGAVDRVDVAPAVVVLAQDVRGRRAGRPGRSAGSWTSGASGARAAAIVKTAGSSSYSTRTSRAASSAASFVSAATAATGSPWYFVSPTARTGRSCELRPEARHRLRAGRRPSSRARTPGTARAALVSMATIRARAQSSADELDVEVVLEVDVGDVGLAAGDPIEAADAGGRAPMRRRSGRVRGTVAPAAHSPSRRRPRPGPPR